jgi:adenylate cyclase
MTTPNSGSFGAKLPTDIVGLMRLDEKIDETVLGKQVFSLRQLSEVTGWTTEQIADIFLWSAMPKADIDDIAYTMSDSAALIKLKQAADREDLTMDEIGTVVRSLSYAMEKLAFSEVESLVHRLSQRGLNDTEARIKVAGYAPKVADSSMRQIEVLWRRHLAAAIHRLTTETILQRGVSDDAGQFPILAAVGYARIVDFSEVTADFGASEYVQFVQDFNNRTADIVNAAGGRVIKLMGDTAVWVTAKADTSCDIALKLSRLTDSGFPAEVQIGVTWCRLVAIHGDIFGPGVHLAARLAEAAPPGEVYLNAAAAAQIKRNLAFALTEAPPLTGKGAPTEPHYQLKAASIFADLQ